MPGVPDAPEHHHVAERLWQLRSNDLWAVRQTMPDDEGTFRAGRLPVYLHDPDRAGYLIRCGAVCRASAHQVLGRHPGRWEIAFQEDNRAATSFWRQAARDVSGTRWSEERRPIPDKPDFPPDTWLSLTVPER